MLVCYLEKYNFFKKGVIFGFESYTITSLIVFPSNLFSYRLIALWRYKQMEKRT